MDSKLIIAILTLAAAVLSYLASLRNRAKLNQLEIRIDGRMEKLMTILGESERAQGVAEGIASERANPMSPAQLMPPVDMSHPLPVEVVQPDPEHAVPVVVVQVEPPKKL